MSIAIDSTANASYQALESAATGGRYRSNAAIARPIDNFPGRKAYPDSKFGGTSFVKVLPESVGLNESSGVQQTILTDANRVSDSMFTPMPLRGGVRAIDSESTVSKTAKERARLIAMKAAKFDESNELIARLELLNQRMLEIAPRITSGQIENLEAGADLIERISARRQERARARQRTA